MTSEFLAFMQHALTFALLLSVQLLVILALRKPVCRWFGAANAYRLWLLPVVWLPFALLDWTGLNPALFNWFNGSPGAGGSAEVALFEPLLNLLAFDLDQIIAVSADSPASLAARIWLTVGVVWFVGAGVLLAWLACQLIAFNRYLRRTAVPVPAQMVPELKDARHALFLDGLGSPALYGLLRPVLLLPADFHTRFDADERHIMLAHEAVHLQRRDNLWNLCAGLLKTLFWINPLLYPTWRSFRLDQELSCDAQALRHCNAGQGKRFARTLLETVRSMSPATPQVALTGWDGLHELRERSTMIRHHLQRSTHPRLARCCLLLLALGGAALTTLMSNTVSTPALAADSVGSGETLRHEFYEAIQQVMELRGTQNYPDALNLLDVQKQRYDAGLLNGREIYTLWLFYASIAQAQKDYLGALQYYKQVLEVDNLQQDQLSQTLMMIGSLHFALEEFESAIEYFKRMQEIDETRAESVSSRLAVAYYQLGRYAEAIPYAEQTIATNTGEPHHPDYSLLRAIYLTLGQYEQARLLLNTMVELFDDPEDERLLKSVAEMLQSR